MSNFLIQAALQRADDKALAVKMVAALGENASDLLKSRRAGVLWRAAQACVRLGLNPKTQTKLLEDIAGAVQAGHTGAAPPPPSADGDSAVTGEAAEGGDSGLKSPTLDAFRAAREWVPALLSPRLPGEGGLDRLFLNVPGARIVQNILLFDPPVAAPVLKAVAALPEAVLAAVARDNMGSRCLLDPILEAAASGKGGGGRGKNRPAEDARRSILRAFRGHLVAMACDRVAWHILLKCFRGVDMKEKRWEIECAGDGNAALFSKSAYGSPCIAALKRHGRDPFCVAHRNSVQHHCRCTTLRGYRAAPYIAVRIYPLPQREGCRVGPMMHSSYHHIDVCPSGVPPLWGHKVTCRMSAHACVQKRQSGSLFVSSCALFCGAMA